MKFIVSTVYDGKRRKLYSRFCAVCEKKFYAPKCRATRFCSIGCRGQAQRTRLEVSCEQCKKTFLKRPSTFKNSVHQKFFCSRVCKDLGQSFKGNCAAIHPAHYGSPLEYRGRIELDICVGCGESRRFLLLTHHKDGNRKHNLEENLECVCHNCHVIRHLFFVDGGWRYSTKKLTPRELLPMFTGPVAHLGEREACTFEAAGS